MFGGLFGGGVKTPVEWSNLESISDLDKAIEDSFQKKQVLFKHSTRCSISSMAFNRLQSSWSKVAEKADFHYLDLIQFRDVSNAIADKLGVMHQSPQLLVLEKGKCVAHSSHNSVSVDLV